MERLERLCAEKGLRMTEQRKIIARVLSTSDDHPDAEELHRRANDVDNSISLATVYRTVKLFEEAGIIERHEFRDGRARFDLRLDGPLGLPALSGTVASSRADFVLPGLPIGFRGMNADIRLSGGRAQIQLDAPAVPGGQIRVSGPVTLSAPFRGDLDVRIAGLQIEQPGLLQTTANGQISVDGPLAGGARIAGRIDLGATEIRVADAVGSSAATLPGLRHVGEPAASRRTRQRAGIEADGGGGGGARGGPSYPLDVTVSAPSRIFVRGRGLDAELGGSVTVRGTTTNPAPAGQFSLIRGRMDVLGQRLNLTEASAQLRGGLDPLLRLVAETDAGQVLVRILVEGTASEPEISVSSVPELPQDEVFARLLFGKDISEITPFQALRIAAAVAQLLGVGGDGIVSRLRTGFGLDDFDIVTNEDGTTGVRAGKYISENVYSDVTTSSNGETEVNINLDLTPNLTVRGSAASDGGTGLGIFYERDY